MTKGFCLYPDVDWMPIIERVLQAKSIHLITHRLPDSDGIGSQIALFHALQTLGKHVVMHNWDPIPRICRYLPRAELIGSSITAPTPSCDLMFSLDAGSLARLHISEAQRDATTLINIDHHVSNTHYGHLNIVDARYCATGAMVFDLLTAMEIPLTAAMAQALYAAILTDTSSFQSSSVTADVYRMAACLIDAGADAEVAAEHAYASHKVERFTLLKESLNTLTLHDAQASAWMHLTIPMFEQSSCTVEDSEGFIEYARSIAVVDITVLMCQLSIDSWKVTFRGKNSTNVGDLAIALGGGGHRYAAGCTLEGSESSIRAQLRAAVTQALELQRS
ncbi:MAG: DHH family phosphoesterase [Mariprofundaceae bacterium]|nr:DHH family phosphoesterase [Mariprofundaceae bacterium]